MRTVYPKLFFAVLLIVLGQPTSKAQATIHQLAVCEVFYHVPAGIRTTVSCAIPCDVPRQDDGEPDIIPAVYSGHRGVVASVYGILRSPESGAERLAVTLHNVDPLDYHAVARIEIRGSSGEILFHSGFDCE